MRQTILRKAAVLFILLATVCTGIRAGAEPLELTRQQKAIEAAGLNAFATENLPSFTLASLDNGIPVVIKRSTTNRILTVKAVLLGHVSLTPVEKAGLEAVTLRMLTRGSARYPYPEFQRILFEKSSSIGASSSSFDATSFDLITVDSYFDELFAVFADAFLHPAWNAEEFPRVMNDFKVAKQEAENDPWQRTVRLLHEEFFYGHPYAAAWDGAGGSLESITLDDVKSYYERTASSGRLILVAVGNFAPA
jgi:zinc protease